MNWINQTFRHAASYIGHLLDPATAKGSILLGVITYFVCVILVIFLRYLGILTPQKILRWLRSVGFVLQAIFGWKFILIYTDADNESTEAGHLAHKLSCVLKRLSKTARFKYIAVANSEDLNTYPLRPFLCGGVILLITDVSPLSTSAELRLKIQTRLKCFAEMGGVVILGHDTIYRRTRNFTLQEMVGCQANKFKAIESIAYSKFTASVAGNLQHRICADSTLMKELPEGFSLLDGEYITGDWKQDVKFLYVFETNDGEDTAQKIVIPVITRREYKKGFVYWLNCGDKTESGAPLPLTNPDETLMNLMVTFLKRGGTGA